jgi:TonB-linked SusC/RagA family outer membrane protein
MKICTKNPCWPNRRMRKLLLVMKITTFLLIATMMQVSASSFAQNITLVKKNITLDEFFREIRKQTGYNVSYSDKILDDSKSLNVNFKATPLESALKNVLDGKALAFDFKDNNIIIYKQEKSFLENIIARFQNIDVRGRVVDEKGSPLIGATVKVKGGKATTTNANGDFSLNGIADDAMLVISYIGYIDKVVSAKSDLSNILLQISDSKLDEIHVIAYGATSKRLTTGNIGGITAMEIEKQPVGNPLLALSGRIPGLFIDQNTGLSGGAVAVNIQGLNSIAKGNDPYYVIDGVPYTSQLLPSLSNVLGGPGYSGGTPVGYGSPFSYLNPSDIESIDVLKDADATAIYGSRAANGAILITTKKGKPGQTKIDLTLQSGISEVGKKLKMLNTEQYLGMRREAYANDGRTLPTASTANSSNYDLTVFDQNRYTDWQKELLGGTGGYMDAQASISGGNTLTAFRLNGGYHRETSLFPGDKFADVKVSIGVSLNYSSLNNKFKLQFTSNYLNDNNAIPSVDLTGSALKSSPNAPALYTPDGSLNWARIRSGSDSVSTWKNPLSQLVNKYIVNTNNLISDATLSYNIAKGLDLKTSLGYTDLTSNELGTNSYYSVSPETRNPGGRSASYSNGKISSWIIEPQLTYDFNIAKGQTDLLVGTTFQESDSKLQHIDGLGYSSDASMDDYSSATTLTAGPSVASLYKYSAVFGRLNYNWENRYIGNFTLRRDGSSRFGAANKFHIFTAAGAAWLFSNEDFIKRNLGFLSFGKLRGSYGTTGNDQIGDYSFLNQYNPISSGDAPVPYQGVSGLEPLSHSNPYLEWEVTKKLQFGFDLGFLSDRILIGAGTYRNRSSNQLLPYQLPAQTGFGSVIRNFPATAQNTGWEFSLNTINIKPALFRWSTNLTLTVNRNKLIAFPNLAESSYADFLEIGQPVNILKVFNYAGLNSQTGLYQYVDAKGNLTNTPNGATDKVKVFDPNPKFYGGFQNSFSYKGFDLDIFFQFVKRTAINYKLGTSFLIGSAFNQPVDVLNRWQKPGDITNIPKFSLQNYLFDIQGSTFGYTDASFIRLKNVSFSYNLPSRWLSKVNIQHCRLFIQGQNLLTITKYIGLDPENHSLTSLPPLRIVSTGLKITL